MAQLAARKPRGNLPAELTSFVGRRRELAAIRSTLADARLLTLTGAGEVGKTRLDPREQLFGVMMVQLEPFNLRYGWLFHSLAYQALVA